MTCFFFTDKLKVRYIKNKIIINIINKIQNRIKLLADLGLDYLIMNNYSKYLSNGEHQKINIVNHAVNSLCGLIYIIDEPSIGLHYSDRLHLIRILQKIRDKGNTIIVVDQDENIIKNSDFIIKLGPKSGFLGGRIVFAGYSHEYINTDIDLKPNKTRIIKKILKIKNISKCNFINMNIDLPLNVLVSITGKSAIGKTIFLKKILFPYLNDCINNKLIKIYNKYNNNLCPFYNKIVLFNDSFLGKSIRSNPVTYIKVYKDIINLFIKYHEDKNIILNNQDFLFNSFGGRCEHCKGLGYIQNKINFVKVLESICTYCNGKRFNRNILNIKIENKNIFNILEMTINEAYNFFYNISSLISKKLFCLIELGLGYLKMGQSTSTLSLGEFQRLKLSVFLSQKFTYKKNKIIFLLDEPSRGLDLIGMKNLLCIFNNLLDLGHSIFIVEHNMKMIKNSDWIIDINFNKKLFFNEDTPYNIAFKYISDTSFFLRKEFNIF